MTGSTEKSPPRCWRQYSTECRELRIFTREKELGMTNVKFENITHYRDIETLNLYRERLEKGYSREEVMRSIYAKSRDNARTPMQWNAEENAGFTAGTPWIEVNSNYVEINAEEEIHDPDSVFSYYRILTHLRKKYPVFLLTAGSGF